MSSRSIPCFKNTFRSSSRVRRSNSSIAICTLFDRPYRRLVDDVLDVVREEATEDVMRLGAVGHLEENYLEANFFLVWRSRVMWLACLFIGGIFTVIGLGLFVLLGRGLVEVRPDGSVARELPQDTAGRAVHHSPETLTLGLPTDGSAAHVRALLDEIDPAGTEIDRFTLHSATLDDVFLALTSEVPAHV